MTPNLMEKRVLVLSDNDELSRAIELNLMTTEVEIIRLPPHSPMQRWGQIGNGDLDLIVVAMSSPINEPPVVLARASLDGQIGRVPLLIISDRPFNSTPDDQIAHLEFPFDTNRLHDKVQRLLQREPFEP